VGSIKARQPHGGAKLASYEVMKTFAWGRAYDVNQTIKTSRKSFAKTVWTAITGAEREIMGHVPTDPAWA
jgi:hypothetical protein